VEIFQIKNNNRFFLGMFMNNFVKRTLSGSVFVALIVGSILLSQYSFAIVFVAFCCGALYEFHKLTNHQTHVNVKIWLSMLGGFLLFGSSFLYSSGISNYPFFLFYGVYVIAVFISELFRIKTHALNNLAYFVVGQVLIAVPFSALNFILFVNNWQPLLLLSVFVTIWVNDSGAYVFGVTFGKHRLFERISPKKSWEGFVGGAFVALLSGYVFSLLIPQISLVNWLLFSEVIVVFSTLGDLIESLIKRTINVKDFGNIIPGHGGLLDRFDSMLLAAPIAFVYLSLLFYQINK